MKLYGVAEVAKVLDVGRNRVKGWKHRGLMPEPTAELAMGPVWTEEKIADFLAERRRLLRMERSRL